MDLLVTLIRMISHSMIHCGSKCHTMGWQIYTHILQGVYIPVGKKLSLKKDFRKKCQKAIFAESLSQEMTLYQCQQTMCQNIFSFVFSWWVTKYVNKFPLKSDVSGQVWNTIKFGVFLCSTINLRRQRRRSVFDMGGWFGGTWVPIARLCIQGGVCPHQKLGKFCTFATGIA